MSLGEPVECLVGVVGGLVAVCLALGMGAALCAAMNVLHGGNANAVACFDDEYLADLKRREGLEEEGGARKEIRAGFGRFRRRVVVGALECHPQLAVGDDLASVLVSGGVFVQDGAAAHDVAGEVAAMSLLGHDVATA